MQRWGGSRTSGFEQQQQELWRRMSFNALVGNHDDHVRNHGLLYRDGQWTLSPAYDIVAMPSFNRVLAMAVTPDGSRRVSAENLVRYAEHFSLTPEDAWEALQYMARLIVESWQELLVTECQVKAEALEQVRPSFNFAQCIVDHTEVPQFDTRKGNNRKKL
jgi:serine/threonine-protein kinase HipA